MAYILPSALTKEQITEFKILFKKQYGIELSDDQANENGLRLIYFIAKVVECYKSFND